jgi:cellulose synthase operon protein C
MQKMNKNYCFALFIFIIISLLGLNAFSVQQPEEPIKPKSADQEVKKATTPKKVEAYEFFEAPDYKQLTGEFFQKLSQETKLLEQIYQKTPPGDVRADVLFRLADVYWLDAKYRNFRDMEIYQRNLDAFDKGQTKTKPEIPKFQGGRSLRIYDVLANDYPKYSRLDEVLFLAGFHSGEINYPNYYTYYEKLIRTFPQSRYIIDAKMSLAEYYFDTRRLKEAVEIYKSVLGYGPTKVYNYALYKLGWCYYNEGDIEKAIQLLKTVIQRSAKIEAKYAIELRDEALKNLVLFYSDLGKIDEALAYFESIGKRDLSRKVLENLATVYYDQAKFKSSNVTYKRLIDFDPMASEVPFYYSRIIAGYQKNQEEAIARKEMEAYVTRFELGTEWYKKNKKEQRDESWDRAEKYLKYLAQSTHEEAQKRREQDKNDKVKYIEATRFYKLYLEKFPAHKNAYDMRFYLAEIYYQLEDYSSASKYYVECINDKSNNAHLREAAVSNTQALTFLEEKEYKEIMKGKNLSQQDTYPKIPFGIWAPKLIEACNQFITLFPNDEKVPDIIYQKAKLYYNYNNFDDAMLPLVELTSKYQKAQVTNFARKMILDIYGIRKDWDNIILWADNFLKDPYFATPENKTYLLGLIQDATFKKAFDLSKKNENEKAAQIFVSLQEKYPDSKLADKALYNAILNYLLVNKMSSAASIFTRLEKQYPSSENVAKANLAIANNYESKFDYRKAAEYYEIFADREPKSAKAPDCLYNAALYRETMEEYPKAIENYKKYISLYPTKKDVPDITFNIAMIYEKSKDFKNAADSFQKYYIRYADDFDKHIEARYRHAQALDRLGNEEQATKQYRILIHQYNSQKAKMPTVKSEGPSKAARYAAKSELILVRPIYDDFEKIKFTSPNLLRKQIDMKARLLKQLQDRYLNIVKIYGDAETGIESLFQIGLIYQKFGESLFHAPIPPKLSPEALDLYQQELEKQAKPIEEKSINAYEECLKKAFELNVYNSYTTMAYEKLMQYKPDVYKKMYGIPIQGEYRANLMQTYNYSRKVELK